MSIKTIGYRGSLDQIRPYLTGDKCSNKLLYELITALYNNPSIAHQFHPELLRLGERFPEAYQAYWRSLTREEFLAKIRVLVHTEPKEWFYQLDNAFVLFRENDALLFICLNEGSLNVHHWAFCQPPYNLSAGTMREIEKYWNDPDLDIRRGVTHMVAGRLGVPLLNTPSARRPSETLLQRQPETPLEINEREDLKKILAARRAAHAQGKLDEALW